MLKTFDAKENLKAACIKHNVHLSALIADTALWAHPNTHYRQIELHGSPAVYPGIRRLRIGQGERRKITNGVGLDDNSYANGLIKRSLGFRAGQAVGYECCHIWPNSCYDTRYHTVIANLVLIPAALASLTDYDPDVQAALQFLAYELYGWHPSEQTAPMKPHGYPENWQEPLPDPTVSPRSRRRQSDKADTPVGIEKLQLWADKPASNVHRLIVLMCDYSPIPRARLIARAHFSKNPNGAISSLMTNKGNAYGLVFIEKTGDLYIHPQIEELVRDLWKRS